MKRMRLLCPARAFRNAAGIGFTLIELLVVIVIVATLAALLTPVFSRARQKAWQANCVSNEREIGAALAMYVQDFDDTYPNYRFEPLGSQQADDFEKNSWRSAIAPHLKYTNVMACPANPDSQTLSWDPKFPISYAGNRALSPIDRAGAEAGLPVARDSVGSGIFGGDLSPGVHAASIVSPPECIAVLECAHTRSSSFEVDISTNGEGFASLLFTGHFRFTNYLFADGHAKALKPTATYRDNDQNFWYRDASPLGLEARITLRNAETQSR